MTNLVGPNGETASNFVIGKAEHLKILLFEWLKRHNRGHYSNPKYTLFESSGDLVEVRRRRKWRLVDYWQSDNVLSFGSLVEDTSLIPSKWRRCEYLYFGRTTGGKLVINNIALVGEDAKYFNLSRTFGHIKRNRYIRVQVCTALPLPMSISKLDARIEVHNNVNGKRTIELVGAE